MTRAQNFQRISATLRILRTPVSHDFCPSTSLLRLPPCVRHLDSRYQSGGLDVQERLRKAVLTSCKHWSTQDAPQFPLTNPKRGWRDVRASMIYGFQGEHIQDQWMNNWTANMPLIVPSAHVIAGTDCSPISVGFPVLY